MISTNIQSMFDNANSIVFLTGAGVSTSSGIPDYRSKNGLYTKDTDKSAEYYLSAKCLNNEPEVFYQYLKENMYYPNAKPNIIHQRQAEFTQNKRAAIITQNIDGLYQKVAAKNLVEFHGNLYDIYCQTCHQKVDYQTYFNSMYHENCGGILRPNVVLYEEGLSTENVKRSIELVSNADLLVVVGTTMRVYPFAGLLNYRSNTSKLIVVNQEELQFSVPYEMIKTDAKEFFTELK